MLSNNRLLSSISSVSFNSVDICDASKAFFYYSPLLESEKLKFLSLFGLFEDLKGELIC